MTMLGQEINELDDVTVELIKIDHTVTSMWNDKNTCIVYTHPPFCWGGGFSLLPQEGLQSLTKNKLQSGMFNDKKSL